MYVVHFMRSANVVCVMGKPPCPECNDTCEVNGDACKSCINAEAENVKRKAEEESEERAKD